ncbi:MAG: inverse autotransporter beta domain-containing protein [Planctomycetaceae bacterium]
MKRLAFHSDQSVHTTRFQSLWKLFLLAGLLVVIDSISVESFAKDKSAKMKDELQQVLAEEEEEEDIEPPDRFRRPTRTQASVPTRTPASADGPGIIGQAGHLAFKTFGRNQSISPIEAMPYILTDEHFFFSDLRGFISNNSMFGGNLGLGYRYLRDDQNAWYGASVWYDNDATSGKSFQQIGLSLEALVDRFELRSNIYLPFSSTQTYGITTGSEKIVGHQLLYSRFIDQGKALQGVDFEAGYSLPVMEKHRIRGFAGYYHFDGGPSGGINGFKTRVEAAINNTVTAQVLYTNDKLYGSNVMLGCSIQFPWGSSHPTSKWRQNTPSPFRFVERNYNVILDRAVMTEADLIAINPLTHTAYKIQQVSSGAAPGGDGTTATPFQTVAAAQTAGADIVLVQGNSVLTTGVVLTQGQQLLGDGSLQPIALDGGGTAHLPTQVAGGATPIFSGVAGTAITMADDSTVGGFKIINNNGNTLTGTSISGVTVRDMTFQNVTGDAVRFSNSSGSVVLENLTINTATGNGINFVGGLPNLVLSANVTGAQSDAITLSNFTGGSVDIHDTTVTSSGGAGLRLNNIAADINVAGFTASQTQGSGIAIVGGSSGNDYNFTGTTTITQPVGNGVNVNSSGATIKFDDLNVTSTAATPAVSLTTSTGEITMTKLTVNSTNNVGLYGRNLNKLTISGGTLTSVGAGAVDVQNSTINVNLASVSTDGGPFGIRLIQNTGLFSVNGTSAYGSGGTIKNTTTGAILNNTGTVALNWMDFTTNGTGIQSTGNAQATYNGLRITGSTGYAIDATNDLVLMITNSQLQNNGAIGGGTIRGLATAAGSYQWLVDQTLIVDHNGTPILFKNQGSGIGASLATTVNHNTITADRSGMSLVDIQWNGPLSSAVTRNVLTAGAANMTGVNMVDSSATDALNTRISQNLMTFNSSQGTGVKVSAGSTSSVQVDNNGVDFKGVNGIGLRFALGGISSAFIHTNTITDEAGGTTGMLFDSVAASSQLQIQGNTINLLSTDLTVHRGIIFTSVTPTIQLYGTTSNTITNTPTTFSIPVNSSTGHIIINNQLSP